MPLIITSAGVVKHEKPTKPISIGSFFMLNKQTQEFKNHKMIREMSSDMILLQNSLLIKNS